MNYSTAAAEPAAASCRRRACAPNLGNHWLHTPIPPPQAIKACFGLRQAAAPNWGIIGILSSHRRRKPKGLLWAYFLTVWYFDTRTVEEGHTL